MNLIKEVIQGFACDTLQRRDTVCTFCNCTVHNKDGLATLKDVRAIIYVDDQARLLPIQACRKCFLMMSNNCHVVELLQAYWKYYECLGKFHSGFDKYRYGKHSIFQFDNENESKKWRQKCDDETNTELLKYDKAKSASIEAVNPDYPCISFKE
jgi:hypothetical protein